MTSAVFEFPATRMMVAMSLSTLLLTLGRKCTIARSGRFILPSMLILLSGCSALQVDMSDSEDSPPDEIQALLQQPYIDPLTDYLRENRKDPVHQAYLARIAKLRDQRCGTVAARFEKRDLSVEVLTRFRSGYQYSCPDQVDAFAARLNAAEMPGNPVARSMGTEAANIQPAKPLSSGLAWNAAANECYLLAGIHNHADAIKACLPPAKEGNLRAQRALANSLLALQQYEKARGWLLQAASQQDSYALIRLAELSLDGHDAMADPALAWAWFSRAGARARAAALETELSEQQRLEARRQVKQQLDTLR